MWKYSKNESSSCLKKADCKTVDEQVEHKISFVNEFVPSDKHVVLIGHSVGAYMVLKMLESKRVERMVCRSILLFPTIENIRNTPNGYFWDPVSYYLRHPFALTAWLLSFCPFWLRKKLIDWRTSWKGRDAHPHLIDAFMHCVSYTLMNNALYLAANEMEHINELDDSVVEAIQRNIDKVTFYYGVDDRWAPVDFYKAMRERFPDGDIRLCGNGFPHDFVVDSSEGVACLVWDMISHLDE